MSLNKLRNTVIDSTVKVLNKAKAKPPSCGTELRDLIDSDALTIEEKIAALNFISQRLEENLDA